MKKGSGEICHQINVRFSLGTSEILQKRAKENGRSLSKEIIQLVEAQLAQSTKKGAVQPAPSER